MMKKIILGFFAFILVLGLAVSTYAVTGSGIILNPDTPTTEQFMATITRPRGTSETTIRPIYMLCGVNYERQLRFEMYRYNTEIGEYEKQLNTKGENSFEMLEPGVFAEEIVLGKNGVNRIRVAAYDVKAAELKLGENLQISDYTVNLIRKDENEGFGSGFRRISTMLSRIF